MVLFLLAAFLALPGKVVAAATFVVAYVAAIFPDFLESPTEFARVLGLLVPLAVAALAKWKAPPKVKSWLNVALSALAGVLATIVGADGGWAWDTFFNAWFNAFVVGIATYYGVYKPTGIAPAVDKSVPGLIGPSNPSPPRA